jgi:hypothetical protein
MCGYKNDLNLSDFSEDNWKVLAADIIPGGAPDRHVLKIRKVAA